MTCTTCQQPTATGIHLCDTCSDQLHTILNQLPELLHDLNETTAKQDNTNPAHSTGSSGFSPEAPANLNALETKMHLEILIQSWASMLNDYAQKPKHKQQPGQPHLAYLRGNVNTIRSHDFSGIMLEELHEATHEAQCLIDLPRDIRILGTCQKNILTDEGELAECNGQIKVDGEQPDAQCANCKAIYNTAELQEWNHKRARGKPMTAAQVRRYLKKHANITVKTKNFENWVRRGRLRYVLELVKTRGREKRLYFPGDVLEVQRQMDLRNGSATR